MNLARAAGYFRDTPVSGWDGAAWVPEVTCVTQLPFDRFVSEREFGGKRRFVLVGAEDDALAAYPAIKYEQTGEVFLVGLLNTDVQADLYSKVYLTARAPYLANLMQFTKTVKASGLAGSVVRESLGYWHGDVEHITYSNSREFDTIKFSEAVLYLQRDCPADTGHEIIIAGRYYDLQESFLASGFKTCRALAKRSV